MSILISLRDRFLTTAVLLVCLLQVVRAVHSVDTDELWLLVLVKAHFKPSLKWVSVVCLELMLALALCLRAWHSLTLLNRQRKFKRFHNLESVCWPTASSPPLFALLPLASLHHEVYSVDWLVLVNADPAVLIMVNWPLFDKKFLCMFELREEVFCIKAH